MVFSKNIKNVYSALQDNESQCIFRHRFQYMLDGDTANLHEMMKSNFEFAALRPKKNNSKNLIDFYVRDDNTPPPILYGAGGVGKQVLNRLRSDGKHVLGFCDSDILKQGNKIDSYSIISPKELVAEYKEFPVIITVQHCFNEINNFLLSNQFPMQNIYNVNDAGYFDFSFLKPAGNDVFVDAGVFDGHDIYDFIDFCDNKYNRIYGIEPDSRCYMESMAKLENVKNLTLLNKAVWDCETSLQFKEAPEIGSSSIISSIGSYSVDTIMIDSLMNQEIVTFIKMDIEGAELKALKGAEATIKKYAPTLIISIYHKPEDIIDIPAYILKLNPKYKLYIRHRSSYSFDETVLYACL